VLIQREVKDPKVGFVGVSDVEVTRDLSVAKVFITHYDPTKVKDSLGALNRSAGFLRVRLGEMLRMRSVPELRFYHDDSVERGERLDQLIETAVQKDKPDQDESQDESAAKPDGEQE